MKFNSSSANAKGKISKNKTKTKIEVNIYGTDYFLAFVKIFAHIFLLSLNLYFLIEGIYPVLILFFPLSIILLAFLNWGVKKNMKKFKVKLIKNFDKMRT